MENLNEKKKSNIIDFYIKTNDTEVKAKVLIDFGSDLNFIHPEFTRINNIKLNSIEKPFKVAGLGHGASNVTRVTEKCTSEIILKLFNYIHFVFLTLALY